MAIATNETATEIVRSDRVQILMLAFIFFINSGLKKFICKRDIRSRIVIDVLLQF